MSFQASIRKLSIVIIIFRLSWIDLRILHVSSPESGFAEPVSPKTEKSKFENFDVCLSESAIARALIFGLKLRRKIVYIAVLIIESDHVTNFLTM